MPVDPLCNGFVEFYRQVHANDLKENINKLNDSTTFLIKHSQKLFRVRIQHSLT